MCPYPQTSERINSASCQLCPAGAFFTAADTVQCHACPANSHSRTAGLNASSCLQCPAGRRQIDAGAPSCVNYGFSSLAALIGVVLFFAMVIVVSLVCLPETVAVKMSCLTLLLLPTIDVASDSMYFSYQTFYNLGAFVSCGVLLFLPMIPFAYELWQLRAVPGPVCRQHLWHLWWLGVDRGYPTVRGERVSWAFEAHDNVIKFLIYWVAWMLVVLYQVVYACPLYFLALVDAVCYVLMLFVGYFLYQTKSLSMNYVFNKYMALWLGADKTGLLQKLTKPNNVVFDFAFFNKSLLAEFATETFPQLIVQSYNNTYTNQWTSTLNVVSALASIVISVNGLWRMLYWKVRSCACVTRIAVS